MSERSDGIPIDFKTGTSPASLFPLGILWVVLLLPCLLSGCMAIERPKGQRDIEFLSVLSEPRDPLGEIQYEPGSWIRSAALAHVNDSLIAVGTWDKDVFFVDVTEPADPSIVSAFRIPGHSPTTVFVMDNLVYMSSTAGLTVADIRDPSQPKKVGYWEDGGKILAAEDGLLFLVHRDGSFGIPRGIRIWDATSPPSLTLTRVYYTPPQSKFIGRRSVYRHWGTPTPRQLETEQDILIGYLGTEDARRVSCNPGILRDADVENGLLYISVGDTACRIGAESRFYEGMLWIVDVKNPEEPVARGLLAVASAYDIQVSGNYAYLATGGNGLKIVGVSNPEKPALVGAHDTPFIASVVAVEDDIAYIGDWNGLQVFDVSNPEEPLRIGELKRFYNIDDIVVSNGVVYLAGTYQGTSGTLSKRGIHVLRLTVPK